MNIPGLDLRPVYNAFDVMASQQSSPPFGYESSDDHLTFLRYMSNNCNNISNNFVLANNNNFFFTNKCLLTY